MRIVYDAQIFANQRTGGISRYHYELLRGMRRMGVEAKVAGRFVRNQYLLSDRELRRWFVCDPLVAFAAFNKMALRRTLGRLRPDDVFHPADAYPFLMQQIEVAGHKVFTIHDMILEKENIERGNNKLFYARNAERIIAVSQATKRDVVGLFGIDAGKIEVIYHGSSLGPRMARRPAKPVPDDYLLYVGNRNDYKNFVPFLYAVAPLLRDGLRLVCAGKEPFSERELAHIEQAGAKDRVIAFTGCNDSELAWLYCKAKTFVFPSFAEGFGIPVLEAWACGTPVILSRIEVFEEVAAEAGHYFDPLSQGSMTEAVERVLRDAPLRRELIEKGAGRLQHFSWEKTAAQTLDLYRSLM